MRGAADLTGRSIFEGYCEYLEAFAEAVIDCGEQIKRLLTTQDLPRFRAATDRLWFKIYRGQV